jgi:hypothetical protein
MKIVQKTIVEKIIDEKKAELTVDNDMALPLIYQALLEMKEMISQKMKEQEEKEKEPKEEEKKEVENEG